MKLRILLRKPQILLIMSALGLTLIVGVVTFLVMQEYQLAQPIWVEQAAYGQWPMVRFHSIIQHQGIIKAIQMSLTTSDILINRHLLEIWLLGVFTPELLVWFQAPLLVVTPIFAIFLFLFGWTVYRRTSHIGYSVGAMFMFCGLAELTRHNWGIGSGFADWQSMLLLSSSVLCLINAFISTGFGWIRAFAVFVSLAILARITVVFYLVVICGPILVYYLIFVYRNTRSLRPVAISLINILLITTPLIILTLYRLPNLFIYYGSSNAWNLKQSLVISVSNIFVILLRPFIGTPLLLACILLLTLNIYIILPEWRRGKNWQLKPIANLNPMDSGLIVSGDMAILWWCFGFIGFLLVNGYTSDVPKEVMYSVPPFLLFCMTPFSRKHMQDARFLNWLTIGIILFCIVDFAWFANQNMQFASTPRLDQKATRQIQLDMADALAKFPQEINWQSFAKIDWGMPVSLLTLYEHGRFQESRGWYFYNKKEYWDTWYSGLTLQELQEKLYSQTSNCIDVAIILMDIDRKPPGMEDYSYSIAAFISKRIQSDIYWQYIGKLNDLSEGTWYGIFQNQQPVHSNSCLK